MSLTFAAPVTVTGEVQAQIVAGEGATIGSGGSSNGGAVVVNGNTITIPLTNVPNAATTNVKLFGVTDGSAYGDLTIPLSVLIGDANASGSVSSADIGMVKSQAGQTPGPTNFRADVTANGTINVGDVGLVKTSTGTGL